MRLPSTFHARQTRRQTGVTSSDPAARIASRTMAGWAPLIGALLAVVAALMTADLVSARLRIRRALDKELAILDRMPDGLAKEQITWIVRRTALDFAYRSMPRKRRKRNDHERFWWAVMLTGLVLVCVIAYQLITRWLNDVPITTGDADLDWQFSTFGILGLFSFGWAWMGLRLGPMGERLEYIRERCGPLPDDSPKTGSDEEPEPDTDPRVS